MVVFTDSVVPGSVGEWSAYRSRRCEDPGSILKDAALVAAVAILLRTSCSAVARSRSWVGTGAGAAPRTPYVKGVRRSSGGGGAGLDDGVPFVMELNAHQTNRQTTYITIAKHE